MDDLSAMLSQIMSDPDAMRQIQSMASSLGLGGQATGTAPPQLPAPVQVPPNSDAGIDLSALADLLGNNSPPPPPQNNAPDLSALSSLLQNLGLGGQNPQPAAQNNTPDLSALSALLGNIQNQNQPPQSGAASGGSGLSGLLGGLAGGNGQANNNSNIAALTALLNSGNPPAQNPAGPLPNIDIGMISKLSQALSSLQSNRANVDLMLALKPRLKEDRAKKVDDAIRVMQLVQFLPLIKESGLFGEMDNILGGLSGLIGGSGGGLGSLLGNAGGGIGGLLGNLGLAGGRR